jgi:hypothetical protein
MSPILASSTVPAFSVLPELIQNPGGDFLPPGDKTDAATPGLAPLFMDPPGPVLLSLPLADADSPLRPPSPQPMRPLKVNSALYPELFEQAGDTKQVCNVVELVDPEQGTLKESKDRKVPKNPKEGEDGKVSENHRPKYYKEILDEEIGTHASGKSLKVEDLLKLADAKLKGGATRRIMHRREAKIPLHDIDIITVYDNPKRFKEAITKLFGYSDWPTFRRQHVHIKRNNSPKRRSNFDEGLKPIPCGCTLRLKRFERPKGDTRPSYDVDISVIFPLKKDDSIAMFDRLQSYEIDPREQTYYSPAPVATVKALEDLDWFAPNIKGLLGRMSYAHSKKLVRLLQPGLVKHAHALAKQEGIAEPYPDFPLASPQELLAAWKKITTKKHSHLCTGLFLASLTYHYAQLENGASPKERDLFTAIIALQKGDLAQAQQLFLALGDTEWLDWLQNHLPASEQRLLVIERILLEPADAEKSPAQALEALQVLAKVDLERPGVVAKIVDLFNAIRTEEACGILKELYQTSGNEALLVPLRAFYKTHPKKLRALLREVGKIQEADALEAADRSQSKLEDKPKEIVKLKPKRRTQAISASKVTPEPRRSEPQEIKEKVFVPPQPAPSLQQRIQESFKVLSQADDQTIAIESARELVSLVMQAIDTISQKIDALNSVAPSIVKARALQQKARLAALEQRRESYRDTLRALFDPKIKREDPLLRGDEKHRVLSQRVFQSLVFATSKPTEAQLQHLVEVLRKLRLATSASHEFRNHVAHAWAEYVIACFGLDAVVDWVRNRTPVITDPDDKILWDSKPMVELRHMLVKLNFNDLCHNFELQMAPIAGRVYASLEAMQSPHAKSFCNFLDEAYALTKEGPVFVLQSRVDDPTSPQVEQPKLEDAKTPLSDQEEFENCIKVVRSNVDSWLKKGTTDQKTFLRALVDPTVLTPATAERWRKEGPFDRGAAVCKRALLPMNGKATLEEINLLHHVMRFVGRGSRIYQEVLQPISKRTLACHRDSKGAEPTLLQTWLHEVESVTDDPVVQAFWAIAERNQAQKNQAAKDRRPKKQWDWVTFIPFTIVYFLLHLWFYSQNDVSKDKPSPP